MERSIGDDRTPCLTLGLSWTICPVDGQAAGPRLIDDEGRLLETETEVLAKARDLAEARAAAEARARVGAEARIRDLEDRLRRARAGSER